MFCWRLNATLLKEHSLFLFFILLSVALVKLAFGFISWICDGQEEGTPSSI